MQETVGILCVSLDIISGYSLYRLAAPVSTNVREHSSAAGQLFLEQHAQSVQAVILCCQNVRLTCSVIVEGSGKECFRIIAVRPVVGPLSLALESAGDCVVSESLLFEFLSACGNLLIRELRVAAHQVFDDDIHLDRELPLLILHLTGLLDPLRVLVPCFLAVLLCPLQSSLELCLVIDTLFHTAEYFNLIHRLYTHAQIGLHEILVHDGSADSHGNGTDLQVAHSAERSCCNRCASEAEKHLRNILRNRIIVRFLYVAAIHSECRDSLLRMCCKNGCQIYSSRSLCRIQSPHALDCGGIHIHGLGSVAPAGCYGKSDINALFLELLSTQRALTNTSDCCIRNDYLNRCSVCISQVVLIELLRSLSHSHCLLFQRSSYIQRSLTSVNYRTNTDHRMSTDQFSCVSHKKLPPI